MIPSTTIQPGGGAHVEKIADSGVWLPEFISPKSSISICFSGSDVPYEELSGFFQMQSCVRSFLGFFEMPSNQKHTSVVAC